MNCNVWGRSEHYGPFTRRPFLHVQRRLAGALPWRAHGMDVSSSRSSEKAAIYNFGPEGPSRRQRKEIQRQEELARHADRMKKVLQGLLLALFTALGMLWVLWMR